VETSKGVFEILARSNLTNRIQGSRTLACGETEKKPYAVCFVYKAAVSIFCYRACSVHVIDKGRRRLA
jgi:hypothetical protein